MSFLDSQASTAHNDQECKPGKGGGCGLFDAGQMLEFLQSSEAQVVLWTLCGAALLAIGIYVMKRFRDRAADDRPGASELLTNFREIHSQGGLSDEEFRTIKAQLAAKLQREINHNDNKD
jgi:hypothetical protein